MTASGGHREARLALLRERGDDRVAPLWLDALPPEQGLREVRGRAGLICRLQEADFLATLGRAREAGELLRSLSALPAGLGGVRDRLLAALPVDSEPAPARQIPPAPAALEDWLDRVRRWRRGNVV